MIGSKVKPPVYVYAVTYKLQLRKLCLKKHRTLALAIRCRLWHEAVPHLMQVWCEDVDQSVDLQVELRICRRYWRKEVRRWKRKLSRLHTMARRASPGYKSWTSEQIRKHEAKRPQPEDYVEELYKKFGKQARSMEERVWK